MTVPVVVPPDLDPNKIAAEFLQAHVDKAFSIASHGFRGARDKLRVKLERTYDTYVRRLLDRHSRAKSFFIRSEPISLYRFFVPLDVVTDRRTIPSAGAADIAAVAPRAILTGSGGSGKSMIMRHILLSALRTREKIPVFLELRTVDLSELSLEEALLASLNANGLEVESSYLRLALGAGHFVLLLDGYDELDKRTRSKVATEVQALAERYTGNWIVLSSRPDPELEGWTAFSVLRVAPLSIEKAVSLVERLDFDSDVKARFVRDLRSELFARHQSFLSNPLLLSIMLLTYHDTAHIPSKLSIFYNSAYEALFQKHDALKSGYQRARRTTLDIRDFERVFSTFCVRTYSKRQFSFPLTLALDEFDRCRSLTHLEFSPTDFLADAKQAVCLLVEEGQDITFAHRSFQEYFAARFVASAPPQAKAQLIKKFGASVGTDAVIPLLFEIDPFAVEQHYVLPALQRIRAATGLVRKPGVTHYRKFLRKLYETIQLTEKGGKHVSLTIADLPLFHAVLFIQSCYLTDKTAHGAPPALLPDPVALLLPTRFPGVERVPIDDCISDPATFAALRAHPHLLGFSFFEKIVAVEASIRQRHSSIDGSLDAILG